MVHTRQSATTRARSASGGSCPAQPIKTGAWLSRRQFVSWHTAAVWAGSPPAPVNFTTTHGALVGKGANAEGVPVSGAVVRSTVMTAVPSGRMSTGNDVAIFCGLCMNGAGAKSARSVIKSSTNPISRACSMSTSVPTSTFPSTGTRLWTQHRVTHQRKSTVVDGRANWRSADVATTYFDTPSTAIAGPHTSVLATTVVLLCFCSRVSSANNSSCAVPGAAPASSSSLPAWGPGLRTWMTMGVVSLMAPRICWRSTGVHLKHSTSTWMYPLSSWMVTPEACAPVTGRDQREARTYAQSSSASGTLRIKSMD
mmetsp:Transcript_103490/g.178312  ORF Transcript_103490/g.178312 Transcript_103490/m.178312 type:complete len:311 (+) Transcript_103490:14894-15826(+)